MKKKKFLGKIKISLYVLCLLVAIIAFAACLFDINVFGGAQFEQIVDTFYAPKGSSIDVIFSAVKYCLPIVLVLASILLIPLFIKKKKDTIKFKIKNKEFNIKIVPWYKGLYTFLVSFILIGYSLYAIGFYKYVLDSMQTTKIFEDYYVDPKDVELTFPDKKRNLIYILVESMESSYANFKMDNQKINLIPNLTNLAEENVNFSHNNALGGSKRFPLTTWTAAGTVAQIGGIPLKTSIKRNQYGKNDSSFLPGATMIGDILHENGYNNYYLIGSKIEFAGQDHLFSEHGDYKLMDYRWAKKEDYIAPDYKVFWGLEDKKLFNIAKSEILKASMEDKPFNFMMVTIDMHAVDGYLDKDCEEKYDYKYANVISCTDNRLMEFILWLQEQDFYENTTVVISGDHLTMQSNVRDYIGLKDRSLYNVFINSAVAPISEKHREFTSMDMYPTTLASLGVQIKGERLAMGTNLFADKNTLSEEIGRDYYINEITKKSKFYKENILREK